jgi:hypothetical protein|tara:strand:+ start:75 stop:1409 length:1335 start_codon:yes stop_codon:yes gene_type:complete
MASSTRISRNEADPTGNTTTFTLSQWVKRSKISAEQAIVSHRYTNSYYFHVRFNDNDTMNIEEYVGNNRTILLTTNRQFRDACSWYHIVVAVDTTQATASNRIKLYINGTQETSFSASDYPSQNANIIIDGGAGYARHYGDRGDASMYFDGLMSHAHYTQGTAYAASSFGSTDATTGEWKINTAPNVTYGTKGYFIFKDANSVTDQSGNSNNFTVANGTFTKTEDNPSNIFANCNPLASSGITISFGNTGAYKAGSGWKNVASSLGASTGKYYAECKVNGVGSNGVGIGFVNLDKSNLQNGSIQGGEDAFSAGIYSNSGAIFYASGTTWKTVGALSNNDIVQLAMDLTNGFLYWGKNGTWFDSANPASGATGTGGLAISNLTSGGTYAFNVSVRNGGDVRWNYGNGFFETTAVASAGTNASNIGIFEYDVPSGYTALSTKGLNL